MVNQPKSNGHGGARPGAGRKSKAEELGLKALLDKCWTVEQRERCILALARKAAKGEISAVTLLMNYAFGKPKELQEQRGTVTVRLVRVDRPIGHGAEAP